MQLVLRRIWLHLTADRKRFAALLTVLSIGLLLWARIIVISNPPRRAAADNHKVATEASAPDSATTSRNRSSSAPISVVLERSAPRDPFHISAATYPRPNVLANSDEDSGKLHSGMAEDAVQADMLRTRQIRAAAEGLKLEAVMPAAGLAVIDGRMCSVGDTLMLPKTNVVFKVIEVRGRSVMIECEERQVELRMANPMTGN